MNGKIAAVKTGNQRFTYNDYGDQVLMDEYKLTSAKGISVTAYKAVGVMENGVLCTATAAESSNCLGWALTHGEYTFIDNPGTSNIDEGMITRVGFTSWSGYEVCSKEEASLIMVYDSSTGGAVHAGSIATDGTYSAKGGGSQYPLRTGMTEDEFFKPWEPKFNPVTQQMEQIDYRPSNPSNIVYYKKIN